MPAEEPVNLPYGLGWKPQRPDFRDLRATFPANLTATLPPKNARFGNDLFPPIWDQGELGSCTAHAILRASCFAAAKQKKPADMLSRLMLYWDERDIEGTTATDAGAAIRDGIKSLVDQGACLEPIWPYDISQFAVKPPPRAYENALQHQAIKYAAVAASLPQIKSALISGFPVIFGTPVYQSAMSGATAAHGIWPVPGPFEQQIGGHAIVFNGYWDDATQLLGFDNSWSPNWGQCLTGDTAIALVSGEDQPIGKLAESGKPIWVWSYDHHRRKVVPALATPKCTGVRDDLLKVTLDNGESVTCTEDHLWMARDGSYRRADDLRVGDSLMPLYRSRKKGYEKIFQPMTGHWHVAHWSVVHELGMKRDDAPHLCGKKCTIVVHHKDFNGLNNHPDNLECMFSCEHYDLHQRLGRKNYLKEWREGLSTEELALVNAQSSAQIRAYNAARKSGLIPVPESIRRAARKNVAIATAAAATKQRTAAQLSACRENGKKIGSLPKEESHRHALALSLKAKYAAGQLPVTDAQREARRKNMLKIRKNHKVTAIEKMSVAQPVFDLTVDRFHNFALGAGAFVHNSGTGFMPYWFVLQGMISDCWIITDVESDIPTPPPPTPSPTPDPAPTPPAPVPPHGFEIHRPAHEGDKIGLNW